MGISLEALEKVFEPFTQADTSVTRRFGGTGLGLAICRQLADAMGGGVTAMSEQGKGSIFTMTVDTGSLEGVKIGEPGALSLESEDVIPVRVGLPACKILVVDDNEVNRNLAKLILSRAGATVETAENGQEAVDRVPSGSYDIVLMDMQMPILDGYAATRKLREMGLELPIVALTAHAMQGAEAKCLEAGCNDYLTKPLEMERVISTITRLVGGEPVEVDSLTIAGDDSIEAEVESTLQEIQVISSVATAITEPNAGENVESDSLIDEMGPIVSTLPADDEDFQRIIAAFVSRLADQLASMRAAMKQADYASIRELAHALAGSGGSAGFPAFTDPARRLEGLAKDEVEEGMSEAIERLAAIHGRIKLPIRDPAQSAGPK